MSHSNLPVDADTKLLSHVRIAAPCHVDWDSMTGHERKRFCGGFTGFILGVMTAFRGYML